MDELKVMHQQTILEQAPTPQVKYIGYRAARSVRHLETKLGFGPQRNRKSYGAPGRVISACERYDIQ